jgi:hypothetical protein
MKISTVLLALVPFTGCAETSGTREGSGVESTALPRYSVEGELLRPRGFHRWIFAGASLGLSYSEHVSSKGPGTFHNVYLDPRGYEEYIRTGKFPEKTTLVLALYEPREKESIQQGGYFEGNLLALEAAVKDHEHFPEGWAYFDFGKGGAGESAKPFPKAECHDCHAAHAADDNVFVQFYPLLRDVKGEKR